MGSDSQVVGGIVGQFVSAVNFETGCFLLSSAYGCGAFGFSNVYKVALTGDSVNSTRFVKGRGRRPSFEKKIAK